MSDLARDLIERSVLTERGVPAQPLSAGTPVREGVADLPRSVSADAAAKVPGVTVGVPAHMRGDRPTLECSERVVAGNVCGKCGRAVT